MSANSVAEKMRAQRIEHEQRMTLHQYICSRIPEEAHRDSGWSPDGIYSLLGLDLDGEAL
jgi:hypothetical protein